MAGGKNLSRSEASEIVSYLKYFKGFSQTSNLIVDCEDDGWLSEGSVSSVTIYPVLQSKVIRVTEWKNKDKGLSFSR